MGIWSLANIITDNEYCMVRDNLLKMGIVRKCLEFAINIDVESGKDLGQTKY